MAKLPAPEALTRLVARGLGLSADELRRALAPAALNELDEVIAFRRQHLHVPTRWDDRAYLRWRYRFAGDDRGLGELWRVRHGGQVLAILGTEDLRCELDGSTYRGVRVMDLLARTDLRETGIGAWVNQALVERFEFTLATGSNVNSAGIVLRMFEPLSPRRTHTLPLDLRPFLHRRWPARRLMAPTTAIVGNVGLAIRRQWLRRERPRDLAIVAVDRFDDAALPNVAPSPARVHIVHDAAQLNWRLIDNPRQRYWIRLAYRDKSPAGFVAWAEQSDGSGHSELHVADWQYDRPETLAGLLHEVAGIARASHCSGVRMVLQDATARQVAASVGFMPARDDPGRLAGVQAHDPVLAQRLAHAEWALTGADDDTDGF